MLRFLNCCAAPAGDNNPTVPQPCRPSGVKDYGAALRSASNVSLKSSKAYSDTDSSLNDSSNSVLPYNDHPPSPAAWTINSGHMSHAATADGSLPVLTAPAEMAPTPPVKITRNVTHTLFKACYTATAQEEEHAVATPGYPPGI